MIKHTPLIIVLGLFSGVMLFFFQQKSTNETDPQPLKPTRLASSEVVFSDQDDPPSPRKKQTLPELVFLNEEATREQNGVTTLKNRSEAKMIGHNRIPSSIAELSDTELRKRLPKDTLARLLHYEEQLSGSAPEHLRYFCWAPQTQPEIIEAFHRVEVSAGLTPERVGSLAFQFIGIGHWNQTATNGSGVSTQGQPVTVTWSIAPDNTAVPSGGNNPPGPSNLIAWLDEIYPGAITSDLTQRVWFPLLQESMDNLAAQAGLNLVYEPNDNGVAFTPFPSGRGVLGLRGDIRLSGLNIDGDFGVLGFAFSPDYGDIVLDTADAFFDNTSNNSLRLVNTLTHEIGHALGLGHVCPLNQTKLMEPFISVRFRGAQFDETYSLQRQYGDSLESHSGITQNDSVATATPLALTNDTLNTWRFLSIDDNSDVDYLSFTANAGELITVRVIPADSAIGTYNEGGQNADGSCSAGTPFNPLTQQNLTLEILAPDGVTPIAVANTQPLGATEELSSVLLTTTGTYYLRINGNTANSSQLYELQAEIITPPPSPLLEVTSTRLIAESNSGGNGAADPGETLIYGVTLTNIGTLDANNLSATLSGPAGFVPFSTTDGESFLATSTSSELQFIFSPAGNCGDTINLSLAVSDSSGYSETLPLPLTLGGSIGVCDPFRPTVTLTTTETTLIEGDSASNIDLTLTTPLPLASDLIVTPLISGDADSNDLTNAPSFTLLNGNTTATTTISAVSDNLNEGIEEFTLSLSSSDPNFAAGTPSITNLIIDESFSSWAESFGLTVLSAVDDSDNDGQLSVVEYLYNTNPNDDSAFPLFQYASDGNLFSLITPPLVPRSDVTVEGETSTNLADWSSDEVIENNNGFSIPASTDEGFFRLKITFENPSGE